MAFSDRLFDYSSDRLIPCVVTDGPPTEKTDGAIGVLCIDKENGNLYKCVSANYGDRVFTWKIVGEVSDDQIRQSVSDFLTQNPVNGGLSDAEKDLLLTLFRGAVYQSELAEETVEAFSKLQNLWSITANPDITPDVSMTGISAVYSGGDVAVGTAVADLTRIVVTAHYSDGTSEPVTGYTLSGEIAEGSNTITVSYGGKTTTFTVTGVAESGGEETEVELSYGAHSTGVLTTMYTDSGTTTTKAYTGPYHLSEKTFTEDTTVRISATGSGGYFCIKVGSLDLDTKTAYFVFSSGDTATPYEITYTVKAGYKLIVVHYSAASVFDTLTVTEVA